MHHDNPSVATPRAISDHCTISYDEFLRLMKDAKNDPAAFWAQQARQYLTWQKDFTVALRGDFHPPVQVEWFADGQLNVSENCLDRHVAKHPEKTALIWVGDNPDEQQTYSYQQLYHAVCRWANLLQAHKVQKGDRVVIYLPMIPEAAMAMLACARIGAVHVVVFGGFSAQALHDRIQDTQAKLIITADIGWRGGKKFLLKEITDQAIINTSVETILVVCRDKDTTTLLQTGRDYDTNALLEYMPDTCPAMVLNAEDPLFILYTSGSTGKPKGLLHTQAGYLLYAMLTQRVYFDIQPDDIFFCTADIGWITGHSYVVYGALANGITSVLFEGVPTYPTAQRYWEIIDRYQVTKFYTAPTALRSLMRLGDEPLQSTARDSLKIIGSVGEPINPEVWRWYFETVGKQHCAVVDTWWQTETGGHVIAPPPCLPEIIPGSAMLPFFGHTPVLIDAQNKVIDGTGEGALFLQTPWPGMARSVWGNHDRFIETYFSQAAGLYCTGDGAVRDAQGYYTITGRVDDVINVSGHRFGTAEIESALVDHADVAEAAVIGRPHDIKGTGIYAYVTLKESILPSDTLKQQLILHVRQKIGAIASPDWIQFAPALPKTRSGKIMRRILRKIACGDTENLGDISTLSDPDVVTHLVEGRVD